MYTEEDFWRDYPPTEEPFLLPWQKEYHDREIEKAAQKAAQKALMEGEAKGKMETAKALLSMGMQVSIISKATALSEEQILSLKEPPAA